MKHTLLLASVLLAFIACSDKELEEKERLAQSAVRGKVLFEQCVVCHGERAEKSYMEESYAKEDLFISLGKQEIFDPQRSDGLFREIPQIQCIVKAY